MKQPKFAIRRATNADKQPVIAFCAATWESGDYIGAVWDDWIDNDRGALLVGTIDEQPVALAHVDRDGDQAWFEGLRVDPAVRGRGLGRQMLLGSVDHARAEGARVLRLLTNRANQAMMRLLPQIGFAHCFDIQWYAAPPLDAPPPAPFAARAADLLRDRDRAPVLRETGGLYADGWSFWTPTAERMERHLDDGCGVRIEGAGWAIVMSDGESDRQVIALLAGDTERLLIGLRSHSAARETGEIRIALPSDGPTARLAEQLGYTARPNRFGVYALLL